MQQFCNDLDFTYSKLKKKLQAYFIYFNFVCSRYCNKEKMDVGTPVARI